MQLVSQSVISESTYSDQQVASEGFIHLIKERLINDIMKRRFSQYNETDTLKTVIIGRWEGFHEDEKYSNLLDEKREDPSTAQLKTEFEAFQKALEENGVEVLITDDVGKFLYDQLTPRDVAVVIGDKIIICNMAKSGRKYEIAGIFPHIRDFSGGEPTLLIPPVDCLLEGGG